MAKHFDSRKAAELISEYNSLCDSLETYYKTCKAAEDERNKEIKHFSQCQILKVLDTVPVEELNREKDGFRTGILRSAGYETVSDVWLAKTDKLAEINGISKESAEKIRKKSKQFAYKVKTSLNIRLSTDDRNPEATAVICAIYKWRKCSNFIKKYGKIIKGIRKEADNFVTVIQNTKSRAGWLFTSSDKKAKGLNAYVSLEKYVHDSLKKLYDELSVLYEEAVSDDEDDAWRDFEKNTVKYINIIEKAEPDLLGNSDTRYGLPETIAKEVEKEKVLPRGLKCELRKYQELGVKYILHQKRVLLGDEMGLGKTVQAIAAMVSLKNAGENSFAVVCPASVISNWCKEIERHSDLEVKQIYGQNRIQDFEEWIENGGVAVTTYETVTLLPLDSDFNFSMLVVDEAHYIKNPEAQRTKSVTCLSEKAERLLFMTGTALENNVEEMISLIEILQPETAKEVSKYAFMASAENFREKAAPVYYRRKREDVLKELPKLIQSEEWCRMTGYEEKVYEKAVLEKNFALSRRVSWNVDNLKESSKAARLMEIIDEATAENRKIIVFSFFIDTAEKVRSLLGDRCAGVINGSVNPKKRQQIIDGFEKAPAGSVLVSQIRAGGTGLNIQAASVVIICEPQLVPSIESQAVSRAYRMGQSRNVLVYRLLCENTVDERMMDILAYKEAVFNAFADESTAAQNQNQISETRLGEIIDEEIIRINSKNGNSDESSNAPEDESSE